MDLSFLSLAVPAFIAGLITFLAPCTLPLVPAYLGFISGVSSKELENPETAPKARRKIFINGLLFVIGFSVVFIVLGTLIAFVGATVLAPYRLWLARIGGVFIIIFGLFLMGVIKIPALTRERHLESSGLNPFLIGSFFAIGWTPCVGPVLASILVLATTSTTALQGAILLAIFSAGMSIPFLAVAAAFSSATKYIEKTTKYLRIVSMIGGVFLVLLGVLLALDRMPLLISWGYQLLQFINYEAIINYL